MVGIVMPQFSGALGAIWGSAVAGMLGGGAGAAFSKALDTCATGKDISDAANQGMLYGGITGVVGGAFGVAAAYIGAGSTSFVNVSSAVLTNSIGMGLDLTK